MTQVRKEHLVSALKYLIIFGVLYYAVPIPTMFYPEAAEFLESLLLMLNPLVCFLINIIFAMKRGFVWYFPLLTGGVFGPAILLFYNNTALPYLFSYIVLSYIGAFTGFSIFRDRSSKQ